MGEGSQPFPPDAVKIAKLRTATVAENQDGRIATYQLVAIGVDRRQPARWTAQGYLFPVLPRVYGVGHKAPSIEADLMSALLYAGPGAMLDGLIAAWWIGAVRERPQTITVATPRRCRSLSRGLTEPFNLYAFSIVTVRGERPRTRIWLPRDGRVYGPDRHIARHLPIAPLPQLFLGLAKELAHNDLRRALAQVVFRRLIRLDELRAACGQGKPGSLALTRAIDHHQPRLAKSKSPWEDMLIFICEDHQLPMPETNEWIAGIQVDAVWHGSELIVEVDGGGNHADPSQMKRDRGHELVLRDLGYVVLRYNIDQLADEPGRVAADIRRHLRRA